MFGDDVYCVDDVWDVVEQGEQDVQLEGVVEVDLQEYVQWWQEDGDEDVDQVYEWNFLVQG